MQRPVKFTNSENGMIIESSYQMSGETSWGYSYNNFY